MMHQLISVQTREWTVPNIETTRRPRFHGRVLFLFESILLSLLYGFLLYYPAGDSADAS